MRSTYVRGRKIRSEKKKLTESENRKIDGRAVETQGGGEKGRDKEMAKSGEK